MNKKPKRAIRTVPQNEMTVPSNTLCRLRAAFDAPMPRRKDEFLLSINFPKASRIDFFLTQIGYIRKRVWIATLLAAAPALIVLYPQITEDLLGFVWVVSSLLPFIALAGITEITRSVSHHMAELEISCKHGFSDIVLARIGILGCADMIMFAVVITTFRIAGNVEILRLVTYLFVPFLLTCSLSLFAWGRLRSRECTYICGGISCGVSILNAFLYNSYRVVFTGEYMMLWGIAFIMLLIWTAGEIVKLIRRTGEYQWNLSLTA
jgi:hypothetical protein